MTFNRQERRTAVANGIQQTFEQWVSVYTKRNPNVRFNGATVKDLQDEIQNALKVENYELAAEIRDLLTELEQNDQEALKERELRATRYMLGLQSG